MVNNTDWHPVFTSASLEYLLWHLSTVSIYSCRALRKSATSPQHFSLCRSGYRELLRSDLWSRTCIAFHFKPLSIWRNSRVYKMWCFWRLAVPGSTRVQQAASFIQTWWTVMQSDFSHWFIQVKTQNRDKNRRLKHLRISLWKGNVLSHLTLWGNVNWCGDWLHNEAL